MVMRFRTPLNSFYNVLLQTLCTVSFLAAPFSPRTLVQALWSCPAFGDQWSPAMPPSFGRDWVITSTTTSGKLDQCSSGLRASLVSKRLKQPTIVGLTIVNLI